VLTDYHLHLRPDEDRDPPHERWFTEANVGRYLDAAREAGIEELGVSEHIYRFRQSLELWSHPYWRALATDDLDAYREFVRSTPLRLGIELDYVPGAEERSAELVAEHDFDYVVGSVHFIGGGAVDMDEYGVWAQQQDPDKVWHAYFDCIARAARSGLFDILAHPDLVKFWGGGQPGPQRDPRVYYELAVEAIAESGIAVEVSTAGLRKPVGEIYPAPAFAEMCAEAGAAFSLSSDAHTPEQVGYEYEQALALLGSLEVREICVFERRRRRLEPLGPAPSRQDGDR
jgi:histidinol-phosphatase (PHP family)